MTVHVVIPDTQIKPGGRWDHCDWVGRYIVDQFKDKPDIKIVHLGDHWDMPSLSSYDKGTKSMEGRRVQADLDAGNEAFRRLNAPLERLNAGRRKRGQEEWLPEKHFLFGNHEDRLSRAINHDPQMDGVLSLDLMDTLDWERHPFLSVLWLDGIAYSHYFYHPNTGRPYAGMVEGRLKNIGHSFSMGHQQGLLYGLRHTLNGVHHGLVAGSCYLDDEGYKGYQGNDHWRGLVVCHDVHDGQYDAMFVSLDYLQRKYANV